MTETATPKQKKARRKTTWIALTTESPGAWRMVSLEATDYLTSVKAVKALKKPGEYQIAVLHGEPFKIITKQETVVEIA